MRRTLPFTLGLLGSLALGSGLALAEGEEAPAEPPKLEKHPLADSKPGEYLRYVEGGPKWKKWFEHRVIDVREKDGKTEVLVEVMQIDETGKKELGVIAGTGDWVVVPEFKATEKQTYKKDEMVWREVNGKKVAARHLIIEERLTDFPNPVQLREVWYSNDLPAHGKIKQVSTGPDGTSATAEALEWGALSPEVLATRQKVYAKPAGETTPPPPGEKPADGGGGSSCGGGGSSCGK
jgi:hypothetical protein